MSKIHLKKCSTSLAIREMQINMSLRFHLTQVRMAKIKITNYSLFWRGFGSSEILLYCWWECKLVQSLWKSIWQSLWKFGINPPQDPAILLLDIYQNVAHSNPMDTCSTIFIAVLFIISKTCKQPKFSHLKNRF